MRVTRRGWAMAAAGLLLLGLGLLAARPVLIAGGAAVGAWWLAWQYRFVRGADRTVDALAVEQRPARDRVVAGRELDVTLAATLAATPPLALTVESRPPASTSVREPDASRLELAPGDREAATSYRAAWPHAGTAAFDAPAVTLTDALGAFEATVAAGPTPAVTVTPRAPRDVHVGAGGEPVAAAYGEHRAGRRGAGLDPAELREYVPGDAAGRIDWKATARLAGAYVREFEVEADRRLALVVDGRASLGDGPPGETKLDYLREVALAFVASARAFDDPLSCVTVGDGALIGQFGAEADRRHYVQVRRHLAALAPTAGEPPTERGRVQAGAVQRAAVGPGGRRVGANGATVRLADDGSAFATTLRPYLTAAGRGGRRVEGDPLVEAVRAATRRRRGPAMTVLLTDDADPAGVRRAARLARRGEGRAIVYLTPTVLFEPAGLGDLEAAYYRYVAFEDERRALARLDRVEAYEVAPGDRLEAVLAAGRRRRRRVRGGT